MVSPSYAEVPSRVSVSGEFECGLIDAFRRVHDGQIGRRRTHGTAAFAVGEQLFCGLVEAVAVTFGDGTMMHGVADAQTSAIVAAPARQMMRSAAAITCGIS